MRHSARLVLLGFVLAFDVPPGGVGEARAQQVVRNIPYVAQGHERQVLDVHASAGANNLPIVFWIHGGGWQAGDKTQVAEKPKAFMSADIIRRRGQILN